MQMPSLASNVCRAMSPPPAHSNHRHLVGCDPRCALCFSLHSPEHHPPSTTIIVIAAVIMGNGITIDALLQYGAFHFDSNVFPSHSSPLH